MTLPNYEEHEEEFLKAMATRFGFSGKNWDIFMERFREKNINSLNNSIAAYLETELLEGTKEGDAIRIFTQQLSAICDKFEAEGCDYQGVTKGRWKRANRWLREVLYPEWLKQRHLIPLTCWLPKPGEPLLQLREGHLTGLLEYLNLARDCQVLRMAYRVTA